MAETVVAPRIRGFICTTAHPTGCAANVRRQASVAEAARPAGTPGPYRVLVLGASTGYGLAGRIAAAALYDAATVGVFFERNGSEAKTGSPGYYNTAAFDAYAKERGLVARHVNGDAFSDEIKAETIAAVKESVGQVDLVLYSLASPRRTDPKTGETYSSVLKPIGQAYVGKTMDLTREEVTDIEVPPASEDDIAGTVRVMGGDDLELWTDALLAAGVLAPGASLVPLSYIGPEVTYPIYRSGTIGRAKEHLEATTARLNDRLKAEVGGRAVISVNKAVVTQASAAIPTVPLYYSVLAPVLSSRGWQEEPIHQMTRFFTTQLGPGQTPTLDPEGRIRLDDWEMDPEIQAEVMRRWPQLTTETLPDLADFPAYKREFRQLFGFEVLGVDYEAPVEVEARI
jgi:enoyl-[acyl-carrier protein] reductase / trans-2-enoyl-CoA reductase (NAD+)